MTAPVVFISYSHDSQAHKLWVLELATRLRSSGIDAIIDQWELGPGADLPHFMEQSIARASRILMICTDRYVEKANNSIGGVGYEKMIVTASLYKNIDSNRIIPIIRQPGTSILPTFLGTKMYINLSKEDDYEGGFDQLLRELLGAPLFKKPPIGTTPFQETRSSAIKPTHPDPLTQFMLALASVYERTSSDGAIEAIYIQKAMGVSKLLFDYARDRAISNNYIYVNNNMAFLWVTSSGRQVIMQLTADQ